MPVSRTKRAQVAERRRQNIELRTAGQSWDAIAAQLGYSSRGAACQDFGRALKERLAEQADAVDHFREVELERLDALQRKAWAVLDGAHLMLHAGEPVRVEGADGRMVTLRDHTPALQAIDRLLKIAERRSKLLGLDAPTQVEHEGGVTVRYEIDGVDLGALS